MMNLTTLRMLLAVAYLAVDLVYVLLSRSYYEQYAMLIQGSGFPSSRIIGGFVAYTALVIGWVFFATTLADKFAQRMHPAAAGALAGALYGFVVYGVFNGTLYVMFKKYDVRIASRDLMWGVLSATTFTTIYAILSNHLR